MGTHRLRWAVAAAGAVLLVVAGVVAAVELSRSHGPSTRAAGPVADAYLTAWGRRDWAAMAARVDLPPPDFAATHAQTLQRLQIAQARYTPGPPTAARGGALVPYTADLTLAGLGAWEYHGAVPLRVRHGHWLVEWSPSVDEPDLAAGSHLARTRTLAPRQSILAADGTALDKLPGTSTELIGTTAKATAAQAAKAGSLYEAGDTVGLTGLEAAYNSRLAGTPSGQVVAVDAAGAVRKVLRTFTGSPPEAVTTTIDGQVQTVADQVLAPVANPAALVAIDVPSGDVLGAVSHPDGGFSRALIGMYPAGSTFKVVTATAALTAGLTPASPIDCPPSVTVDGKVFTNAEHEQFGQISLMQAFAKSCNTAFVNVAKTVTDSQLRAAANEYGVGSGWPFPVGRFTGSLPPAASPVEHAADAIGQGRVEVSPLEMASIAAAVANGTWQAPKLVASAPAPSTPLPAPVVASLRQMMRLVVSGGTGIAANLAGDPVYGKTGTAEFGTANPPQTHAWFIGWRGRIAFAVLVEDGGFGGDVAAPLAAQFLGRVG